MRRSVWSVAPSGPLRAAGAGWGLGDDPALGPRVVSCLRWFGESVGATKDHLLDQAFCPEPHEEMIRGRHMCLRRALSSEESNTEFWGSTLSSIRRKSLNIFYCSK